MRAFLAALLVCLFAGQASAHHPGLRVHHVAQGDLRHAHDFQPWAWSVKADARPRGWCGWQLRHWLGIADRSFNLAVHWLAYGHPSGPTIGAVAVGRHHVAQIIGGRPGHWIVREGNYNNRIHIGPNSLRWAFAFRS